MPLTESFDRSCFRFLRQTRTPPGCHRPFPSAWVVAIQQNDGHNLVYWVDTSLYWGDGISKLYLAKHYPRTTLVDPAFRPLRRLNKIDCGHRVRYWWQHRREKAKWIKRSSTFEIPVVAKWYDRWFGPSTFGYDVLLRSEVKVHRVGRFQECHYLREAIVSPEHPNAIHREFFFDHREVIAWVEVDPTLQGLHCPKHWNRVYYLDHSQPTKVDGLYPPVGPVVDPWTIEPGFPSQPYTESRGYSSADESAHKAARDEYLRKVGIE